MRRSRELSTLTKKSSFVHFISASVTLSFYPFLFFLVLIILWYIVHALKIVPAFILPTPHDILNTIVSDYDILFPNAFYTMFIAIMGIVLSLICAFIIAILLDVCSFLHTMVYPFILLFQMVPFVLFAPLLVIFLGYGTSTKLIVIILMCFFPILVTLLQGFRFVSFEHIELLQTMKANVWQRYYWVKIPSTLSHLFSGLRLAVSYAMTASIISEWVSSIKGLGYIMIQSQRSFAIKRVYAIIVIIYILNITLYLLVLLLEYVFVSEKRHIFQISITNKKNFNNK